MKTRKEAIAFCLTLPDVYEDYPFHDDNWTLMRHKGTAKTFATIYERQGNIWLNLKCDPLLTSMWRDVYESVIPAYHMNKYHWNSVILDGTIPDKDIEIMIRDSYKLTYKKPKEKNEEIIYNRFEGL